MKRLTLTLAPAVLWMVCAVPGCGDDGTGTTNANDGAVDGSAHADGTVLADGTPTDGPPAQSDGSGLPGCDLTVQLSLNSGVVVSGVTLPAGSEPMLCWTVPPSGPLPGPDGWDLQIFRSDATGGTPEDSEWTIIRGVPPNDREIRYGDCPPAAMGCWVAKTLAAGEHNLAIWDGTRVGGLGGMILFDVQ